MRSTKVIKQELDVQHTTASPVRRVASQRVSHFHDLSFSDLSPETTSRLLATNGENWFSSLGFARSYCFPKAERLCFFQDSSGEIIERCFYRESRWLGLIRRVDVLGTVDPESDIVRQLLSFRRADLLHLHWVTEKDLPLWKDNWRTQKANRIGEDCCIELPKSVSEYLRLLGTKTRKHLPYYVRRLEREWGNRWNFEAQYGHNISKHSYDGLLDLNRQRMGRKGRRTAWTSELRDHRWRLATESGLLCSLNYDGRIVGGTFSFVHAREAYLIVIAHDPQFDRLNLGSVSLWLTIQHLIRSGHNRYHLMWGRSFYKEQFGGTEAPLYQLTLFANRLISAPWNIADWLLLFKLKALSAKVWRRLSWALLDARDDRLRKSHSPTVLLADNAPARYERR